LSAPAILARGLRRDLGGVAVLAGVDLTVEPGELLVLLGPNGAGKTTLLRVLATLLRPSGGTLQVFVLDVRTRTVRQLTSLGRNEDPTWAPDGRHLAFVSDRSGYRQLWVIDLETGRIRPLLQQSGARLPAWSPRIPEAGTTNP